MLWHDEINLWAGKLFFCAGDVAVFEQNYQINGIPVNRINQSRHQPITFLLLFIHECGKNGKPPTKNIREKIGILFFFAAAYFLYYIFVFALNAWCIFN